MIKTIITSTLILIFSTLSTIAADKVITQANKAFSESKVTIKAGDKILFKNDDNVAHNVYTSVAGEKIDLGLQRPGDSGEMSFDEKGNHRVRCAIHPRMKLTVTVE